MLDFQTPQQKMQTLLCIPYLANLEPRIFGCTTYVHIPKVLQTKHHWCVKRCVFVGYSYFQKGCQCYDPRSNKLHVTLDVSFQESEPYYSNSASTSSLQGESYNEGKVL